MSSAPHIKPNSLNETQSVLLAKDYDYFREEDPIFPPLQIAESPHSGLDKGDKSYFFKDLASYAIAVTGLAATDTRFRLEPLTDDGVVQIDVEKSYVTMEAINMIGHYTIAKNLSIHWNTTTDEEAIALVHNWAEKHAAAILQLGPLTIAGEQDYNDMIERQFKLSA